MHTRAPISFWGLFGQQLSSHAPEDPRCIDVAKPCDKESDLVLNLRLLLAREEVQQCSRKEAVKGWTQGLRDTIN
jgi:hypothetical protein